MNLVTLPPDLIARCERYGRLRVEQYASGRNEGSRALSSHGAERNADLQARSVMAECAFCLWAGADIETRINWSGRADRGFDMMLGGRRFDVKFTRWHCHYLIWPVNKRPLFDHEPFDILVLVKERQPDFLIAGWTTKQGFRGRFQIANDRQRQLEPGTWFVPDRQLYDPAILSVSPAQRGRVAA